MDPQELIKVASDFVFAMYPNERLLSITMNLESGPLNLPVPKRRETDGLRDNQRLVYSHLPGPNKPGITVEEILRLTGYTDKSYTHKILKSLRLKGLLDQDEAKGYRRAE